MKILQKEIQQFAEQSGVPANTIDKDYVIGHFLNGLFARQWAKEKFLFRNEIKITYNSLIKCCYFCSMKKSDFNFDIDRCSLLFFNSLSEKNKRLYAALESMKLGYYGVGEIAEKYSIHKHTVRRGQKELLSGELLPAERVRISGGGRKKKLKRH